MIAPSQPLAPTADFNPLLRDWADSAGVPPFGTIRPEHFPPAFDRAFAEHREQFERIAAQTDAPTFDNTIAALEDSGRLLARIEAVFGQLCGTDSNDALLEIKRDISPRSAAHNSAMRMNAALFRRIVPSTTSVNGSVNMKGLQQDLDFFKEQGLIQKPGQASVDNVVDGSFVKAANASLDQKPQAGR